MRRQENAQGKDTSYELYGLSMQARKEEKKYSVSDNRCSPYVTVNALLAATKLEAADARRSAQGPLMLASRAFMSK